MTTDLAQTLAAHTTNKGTTLLDLSHNSPTLLVFLRHFGCTFCRETAADISANRADIESQGATLCFVYMPGTPKKNAPEDDAKASAFFAKHNLQDCHRIADPSQSLYNAFELKRGSLTQLFGPRVWLRGFHAGVLRRHAVGTLVGDGFQMPGVFLLHNGAVINAYRHQHAGSRPDYCSLATA